MVHKTETPPSSIKDRIVDPKTIAVVGDGVVVVGQKSEIFKIYNRDSKA